MFWNVFADSFFLFYSALNRMFKRDFRFRNDYLFVEFVSAVRFAGTEMTRTDKSWRVFTKGALRLVVKLWSFAFSRV